MIEQFRFQENTLTLLDPLTKSCDGVKWGTSNDDVVHIYKESNEGRAKTSCEKRIIWL